LEDTWWHGEKYGTGLVYGEELSKDEKIRQITQAIEKYILECVIGDNREWDTTEPYDNPDIAQGYNEALENVRLKLKDYVK
jgi:hypothetical protein